MSEGRAQGLPQLGARLRRLREAAGLMQEEPAERAGPAAKAISPRTATEDERERIDGAGTNARHG